jgi:hypothetical protein
MQERKQVIKAKKVAGCEYIYDDLFVVYPFILSVLLVHMSSKRKRTYRSYF